MAVVEKVLWQHLISKNCIIFVGLRLGVVGYD
jgi:hypothetical protein